MITGDNRATAQRIAAQLGITDVHSEVLPAGKAQIVSGILTPISGALIHELSSIPVIANSARLITRKST